MGFRTLTVPSLTKRSSISRMSKAIQLGMKCRKFCSNAVTSPPGYQSLERQK